jgi:putative restriction endonuclease
MAKAVFVTKPSSRYSDDIEHRYHFPRMYLNAARQCIGDMVVFYEPRRSSVELSSRGGRQAYFATAQVLDIVVDPSRSDHFFALIDTTTFIEFTKPVRFKSLGGVYLERRLRKADGSTSKGLAGRAIRLIENDEYEAIVRNGFSDDLQPISQVDQEFELSDPPAEFERPILEQLVRRPFRERAFALNVRRAYDARCAMTGIRLINGGGRAEMEAAHIRPVEDKGPDLVRNGIALSRTFHWMFDRGLLSIGNDHKILVAEKHVEPAVLRMLNPDRQLNVPRDPALQPHRQYLEYHRDTVFKG